MASIKFQTGTLTTMLSTELNSLANAGVTAASASFDNTPGTGTAAMWADFELVYASGVAATANSTVDLYLVESVDGTNYSDTAGPPPNGYLGSFVLQNSTSQRIALRNIAIPPTKFEVLAKNNSGQALSASGSTVKMLPIYMQSV